MKKLLILDHLLFLYFESISSNNYNYNNNYNKDEVNALQLKSIFKRMVETHWEQKIAIHMELLLLKIRIRTAVVRGIQQYLNQEILLLLYNSMVKSHLRCYILTWCNGNKTLLQTLRRAANKFISLIFKLKYRKNAKNVMQQNCLLTINQLFENELTCFICIDVIFAICHWLVGS